MFAFLNSKGMHGNIVNEMDVHTSVFKSLDSIYANGKFRGREIGRKLTVSKSLDFVS